EAVGDRRCNRRLARAGRPADEQDDRQVEVVEAPQQAQAPDDRRRLLLAPRPDGELVQALHRHRSSPGRREVGLGSERELVGTGRRDAGRDQGPREQPLREGQAVVAAERQRLAVPALRHVATGSAVAASARARSSASSSGSPGNGTMSFAASTTSTPRSRPASATTSIPAAFTSVRNTSASTRSSSRASATRSERLPQTRTTSAP